ncbi:MAG: hypothetical protein KUG79_03360 [Pseudomonadales bacterium]|nr:hypothetical protein [Pseudomonadales bacterium]
MSEDRANDEIDLKELIRFVLDTKVWLLVLLVVASLAYWSMQILFNIAKPTIYTYQTRLNMVFNGVEKGQYPNGSPFNVNDMIAPAVLNAVFEANNVGEYIDRKVFVGAFSVQPYTPDRDFILARYRSQMEQKNLKSVELKELQNQLGSELRKASADAVSLSFSSTETGDIPFNLMAKILLDIPEEWARHMIEDIGVIRFDEQIYSEKVVDIRLFESIDYLIVFELLMDRLGLLQNNIEVLKSLPNGLVVVDVNSGMNLPDLEKSVADMRRYKVAPLINPVRSLGLAKKPVLVSLYFENELIELNREIGVLKDKKKNIQDAYAGYVQFGSQQTIARSQSPGASMTPQFETTFLDKLVELTDSGADIQYRQKLNSELLNASNKIAEANAEIIRIKEILASMAGKSSSTDAIRESYTHQVNIEMPKIIEQLRAYFVISTGLYDKLSRENLGNSGVMFRIADGEVETSESGGILTASNFRLYFIACFLLVVIAVPVLMFMNAMRKD